MKIRPIGCIHLTLIVWSGFFGANLLAFGAPASKRSRDQPLQTQIQGIADSADGKVAVACSLPHAILSCNLHPHAHPPMQSVFKLPLAVTVFQQIQQGKLSLDQPVRFLPSDRILPHAYSPLQSKYPLANVNVPLRDLLRLSVSSSDNTASDILLRVVGGPAAVNACMKSLGVTGFHLQDNENALHHNTAAQYNNWIEPAAAVKLLRRLADDPPLSTADIDLLFNWMHPTGLTNRLQADLPAGVQIAHKSGTSDVDNGIAHATNDIGLITLPDGQQLAIAIFVTDSRASQQQRERVIAQIARAAYDAAIRSEASRRFSQMR